ncbi:MAG: DUF1284 domain-containing protein [archaeon]|nr:DUF1284 domain-containing protein [archaeon]
MVDTNNPRIQLRGHHIATFALNYCDRHKLQTKREPAYILDNSPREFYKKTIEEYPKKDFYRSEERMISNESPQEPQDIVTRLYGSRMGLAVKTVYALLEALPHMEVEIVQGLDSICNANCPRLQPSCSVTDPLDEDAFSLKAYQLEPGRVYTAGDIVQRVRNFAAQFKVSSPRDVFHLVRQVRV